MLEPQERALFLEALRPPASYALAVAVGTTYSLDLVSLLSTPLAFTFFDWEDGDDRPTADPFALLEAVRENASKITVFCHAGRISMPRGEQLLFSYLEGSVWEALPVDPTAAFHPKVWLLRYSADDAPDHFRLLCSSRNLTFDRSWDTLLVLDGTLTDRQRGFSVNRGLGEFVASLPGLATRPLPQERLEAIDRLQSDVRRVRFEPPGNELEIAGFEPLGIPGAGRSTVTTTAASRRLVVSPFLTAGRLRELAASSRSNILVSRFESLNEIDADATTPFEEVFVLSDDADIADPGAEQSSETDEAPVPDAAVAEQVPVNPEGEAIPAPEQLRGLHAKLFVSEQGTTADIWTGSANATTAAFKRNVEFLIHLRGPRRHYGIDAMMGPREGVTMFRDLLMPYRPNGDPSAADEATNHVDRLVDETRNALVAARLVGRLTPGPEAGFTTALTVMGDRGLRLPDGVAVVCWPTTVHEASFSSPLSDATAHDVCAAIASVSLEALTAFLAFRVSVAVAGTTEDRRFALCVPLENMPDGREDAVLRRLVTSKDAFVRYLLFLLAGAGGGAEAALSVSRLIDSDHSGSQPGFFAGPALFETLLRALDRDPKLLDRAARTIDALMSTAEGRANLPDGFGAIWQPIWEARRMMADHE